MRVPVSPTKTLACAVLSLPRASGLLLPSVPPSKELRALGTRAATLRPHAPALADATFHHMQRNIKARSQSHTHRPRLWGYVFLIISRAPVLASFVFGERQQLRTSWSTPGAAFVPRAAVPPTPNPQWVVAPTFSA